MREAVIVLVLLILWLLALARWGNRPRYLSRKGIGIHGGGSAIPASVRTCTECAREPAEPLALLCWKCDQKYP